MAILFYSQRTVQIHFRSICGIHLTKSNCYDFINFSHIFFAEGKYRIFVPCVVVQELEKLSRQKSTKVRATAATRFIDKHIKAAKQQLQGIFEKEPSFQIERYTICLCVFFFCIIMDWLILGQGATVDHQHIIHISSADDRILNCCLQLANQSLEILLLTNDRNLNNKAATSGIKTMCADEYSKKLD